MNITDDAKSMLEGIFKERGVECIRLYSMGAGCCGPQWGLSLDSPEETDIVETINGIQVSFDPQVLKSVEGLTLDKEETAEGAGFVILGASDCC
ncbi:MAG: adhesin [Bacillota bacterium]